jgi:tRNA (guanine37-N1)-methyltransferase
MDFHIITLFPEMFAALNYGVTGRAIQRTILNIHCINPRDFTDDRYHSVDDRPYGGGPGMVMLAPPLQKAIHHAKQQSGNNTKVLYLSPQGRKFDHPAAKHFSAQKNLILLCGRYEGIDERLIEIEVDEEWSIGDFVLSGGEFATMAMIDAIARLLPGTLGDQESANEDSFSQGILDFPHYTRPKEFANRPVPDVLLRGNHEMIRRWRLRQALLRTWEKRPDLLETRQLTNEQITVLNDIKNGE